MFDAGVLGDRYREDSIIIEPDTRHFELMQPARLSRHIDEMVARLRADSQRSSITRDS